MPAGVSAMEILTVRILLLLLGLFTVLESHGEPVTGTPSISLTSNFIDGEPVIFLIK